MRVTIQHSSNCYLVKTWEMDDRMEWRPTSCQVVWAMHGVSLRRSRKSYHGKWRTRPVLQQIMRVTIQRSSNCYLVKTWEMDDRMEWWLTSCQVVWATHGISPRRSRKSYHGKQRTRPVLQWIMRVTIQCSSNCYLVKTWEMDDRMEWQPTSCQVVWAMHSISPRRSKVTVKVQRHEVWLMLQEQGASNMCKLDQTCDLLRNGEVWVDERLHESLKHSAKKNQHVLCILFQGIKVGVVEMSNTALSRIPFHSTAPDGAWQQQGVPTTHGTWTVMGLLPIFMSKPVLNGGLLADQKTTHLLPAQPCLPECFASMIWTWIYLTMKLFIFCMTADCEYLLFAIKSHLIRT